MNKIEFMRLWDAYSGLLTPTQQEITNSYFNLDLTVSEIADQKGISRQAVSECLSGCKKQLEAYEEKLNFVAANTKSALAGSFMTTDVLRWAENFVAANGQFKKEIEELEKILAKDYSAEAEEALSSPDVKAIYKNPPALTGEDN